ncbi:MAG TPA: phospholipid carrier-dependent glycosyltransferase [Firmicutes bacterium]|nr:phospholipid carrier-dependent glycosyltransferase [Bacillota bacterium]
MKRHSTTALRGSRVSCPGLIPGGIFLAYLAIAMLYAFLTPPWQVPDEPAHYNYIRQLAEGWRLPVLEQEDYRQTYLTRIVEERFPAELSIRPLSYEDHQPPLYYVLALPVYLLSDGSLLALRLFSLTVGSLLIPLTYLITRDLFPRRPRIALGATALVAFLPQHVAILAGVNNDSLAEVLLAVVLWRSIRLAQGRARSGRASVALGICLGLSLLTKLTAYAGLVITIAAVWIGRKNIEANRQEGARTKAGMTLLQILAPAFLLALPWWIRNIHVYGWPDLLGLLRHADVTVGQPRTAQWIAEYGFSAWLGRGLMFTFQSFWGQLGWMSLPMDFRIYQFLALFSGAAVIAFLLECRALYRERRGEPVERRSFVLPALLFGWTLLGYVLYNLSFVQHQGRYLFPALIPVAIALTLGVERLTEPWTARRASIGFLLILLLLAAYGVARDDQPGWPMATAGFLALGLWFVSRAPGSRRPFFFTAPFAGLALLNLYALFGLILPRLG